MENECFLDLKESDRAVRPLLTASGVRLRGTAACYIIENKETQNFYVGSTKNITKRLQKHKYHLVNGTHVNKKLQEEFNNCVDKENFVIEVGFHSSTDEAKEREQSVLEEAVGCDNLLNINLRVLPGRGFSTEKQKECIEKLILINKTEESKQRKSVNSIANWKDPSYRNKTIAKMGEEVVVDGKTFLSVRQAAKTYNVAPQTIRKELAKGDDILSSNFKKDGCKQVSVKGTIYNSVREAARAIGIADNTLTWRCQNTADQWKDYFYV